MKEESFKTPCNFSEKRPWKSYEFCMCGQRFWILLWSKWQQRGKNYRKKKKSWLKNSAKRKCCSFSSMINFVFWFIFSQALKVWRYLFQLSWQMLLDLPIASSSSLPCILTIQNWNKITGSTFPFLDIHLLSASFHKNRFHSASPTYAGGLTSVQ